MKTWTETPTLAALAVLFTLPLAACSEDGPGVAAVPDAPEVETVNVAGVTMSKADAEFLLVTVPARDAALRTALAEMRENFTAEDYRERRWERQWPEIWGPGGWDVGNRAAPPHVLRPAEVQSLLASWRRLQIEIGEPIDEVLEEQLVEDIAQANRERFSDFLDSIGETRR